MFASIAKFAISFFGSSSNGKSVVTQVSDVADKWIPSETSKHEMSLEDQKAGDESQKNAQSFVPAPSHDSWLDILVDAFNRIQRPAWSTWALGIVCGWWEASSLASVNPLVINIVWTVVGFWFGARMIYKDIPSAFIALQKMRNK